MNDLETIAEAFSRTATKYDALGDHNPHLTRLREKVYAHVARHVKPGSRILEINAGTGIDAVSLALRGYKVHATDISPVMLERERRKVERYGLQENISVQECSYLQLEQLDAPPFDAVFSNFGGLNCIPDLSIVINQLPHVLVPGGIVTWVLMPPVCLWEIAEMLRGRFHLAFRRFARGGVHSHLEGLYFNVYYFTPSQTRSWFGREFRMVEIEGLSVITPTGNSKNMAINHPHLYSTLAWFDDRLSRYFPWRGWGDFYIISMQYNPKNR